MVFLGIIAVKVIRMLLVIIMGLNALVVVRADGRVKRWLTSKIEVSIVNVLVNYALNRLV